MCGIVGYIGTKKASPILINGLLRLEYRGYDSAGISTIEKDGLSIMKDKGRVKNLNNLPGIDDLEGTIGIAHTRWATHGKPSKENSHPHMDNSKTFSVVHNGIIENYNELRKLLINNGYTFYSQTDTEIIPNLIHYYYSKDDNNDSFRFLRAVKNACSDLKGSFALEIICKNDPNNMIVVRKDSPLVIGKGNGENYISSDIPAILSFTREFYLLEDLEFVVLSRDDAKFYDKNLNPIDKKIQTIEWNASSAEKDGFEDYMLKEIYEQPTAIRETIGAKLGEGSKCEFDELKFTKEYLKSLNKIYLVACGTAMHAGLAAKNMLERICKIPTEVDIASEFRYRDPIVDEKTLCIFISQSGETADTIAALKLSKEKIEIATLIGLLHDIARFEQYTRYHTFKDAESVDHGDLGVEILNKDLHKYIDTDKYDELIKIAVKNHNKYKIEDGLTQEQKLFAKIIRDADKIDIFYEGVTMFWNGKEELVEGSLISPEVFKQIENKTQVKREVRQTPIDDVLSVLGFIFDINFFKSFEILKQEDYVNKMLNRYKMKDLESEKELEEIKSIANKYIEQRIEESE